MILVRFNDIAQAHLEEATRWWFKNRPLNPTLLGHEVESAIRTLSVAPTSGRRYPDVSNVRRLLLPTCRYHLYYVVVNDTEVEILALWHAQKRRGPPLHILSR